MKRLKIIGAGLLIAFLISMSLGCEKSPVPLQSTETTEEKTEPPLEEPVPEEKRELRITAAGDIMLGRGVEYHIKRLNMSYGDAFEEIRDTMSAGDIVFGNLEIPMTQREHGLDPEGKIVLKSTPESVNGINYGGFNVLSLANNHIMDYYEEGLFETLEILDKNKIYHAGAGKNMEDARAPALMEKSGYRVALLAYTEMAELTFKGNPMLSFTAGEEKSGVAPFKMEFVKEDMEKIRKDCDILIVSIHWGVENSFRATKEQQRLAREIIDAGADIILGHHPHRFQAVEIYEGKPIIYSLGNLIFDQNDPNNQESFLVDMTFTENELTKLTLIPIRTIEKNHVIIPKGENARAMLERQLKLCGELGAKCGITEDVISFCIH